MKDFIAFRTLWNAFPTSEEAYERVCAIMDEALRRSGKPLGTVERALALYKLQTETKP